MQHRRFDVLARALAALLDRRQTLGAFLALLVGLLVAGHETPAKKKGGKKGKGGKGKGKGKKKRKNKRKKRRGGGGGSPRDCSDIPLEPGADLRGCDLRERADFPNAILTNADISDADLSGIDATGADFRGARFWRSRFNDATLEDVELGASNTRKTDLFGVDFSGATLEGAQDLADALYVFRTEEMSDPGSSWYVTFCDTIMPDGNTNNEDC